MESSAQSDDFIVEMSGPSVVSSTGEILSLNSVVGKPTEGEVDVAEMVCCGGQGSNSTPNEEDDTCQGGLLTY